MNKTIATIPKNQREEIRVALSVFEKNGQCFDMASARVYFDDGAGERKPGRGAPMKANQGSIDTPARSAGDRRDGLLGVTSSGVARIPRKSANPLKRLGQDS